MIYESSYACRFVLICYLYIRIFRRKELMIEMIPVLITMCTKQKSWSVGRWQFINHFFYLKKNNNTSSILICIDWLIIKSPKQRLETYCFCSVSSSSYYYYPFFLSMAHKIVHGRSQELLDRISWNLVEL